MKRIVTLLLVLALSTAAFSGCGSKQTAKNAGTVEKTTPDSYPIETDETLTYWMVASGHVTAVYPSLNETPHAAALMEQTGINVKFIHPVVGQENESFNLMISSGELPDIIEYQWNAKYPGGVEKAIQDGIVLPLNDVLKKVSPNFANYLAEHPEIDKACKTTEGNYYGYPLIMDDERLMTFRGPMVREDLLKKAGLEKPETIEEWDTMLREFKKLGIEAPITLNLSSSIMSNVSPFLGAYGLVGGIYVDDGVVKYGPYEKAYEDFVTLLASWYKDGLLDRNFTDTDAKRVAALVTSGKCGSTFGSAGGDFGTWIPVLQENEPEAKFVPVKYPVMNKGDRPFYGQKSQPVAGGVACISASSKNVELAARLLDYGYSEAGHMLYNFGVEGKSYEMVDGDAIYTDNIMNPEKNGGVNVGQAMGSYIRANSTGPFVQDVGYLYQFYSLQEQKDAMEIWSETDSLEHQLPAGIMNAEENREYSKIMSDVEVYKEEFLFKVITGRMSLGEFDNYYKKMKDLGIERAIEIYQTAYDRYNA